MVLSTSMMIPPSPPYVRITIESYGYLDEPFLFAFDPAVDGEPGKWMFQNRACQTSTGCREIHEGSGGRRVIELGWIAEGDRLEFRAAAGIVNTQPSSDFDIVDARLDGEPAILDDFALRDYTSVQAEDLYDPGVADTVLPVICTVAP